MTSPADKHFPFDQHSPSDTTSPPSHLARYELAADSFGDDELAAAIDVLKSRRYSMGENVRLFERALADWLGVGHAVMVNSGSSANLILVDSLLRRTDPAAVPLQPGDEVLVPALAWPTTVWPLVQLGLVPVYVDIELETLGLSLAAAEAALSPRTKALFLIHPLGRACDMTAFREFCERHHLTLIEDCCESLGAFHAGQHVGTFGYGGTLSFYFSHHLTTIEGGCVITHDAALADDLRSLRAHGWLRDRSDKALRSSNCPDLDPRFLFVMPGYNVRPMELQAAIGRVQLRKLDDMLCARERLARHVRQLVRQHAPWLQFVGESCLDHSPVSLSATGTLASHAHPRQHRVHSWMNLCFLVSPHSPITRRDIVTHLETQGVDTRPIIAGNMLRHPAAAFGASRAGSDSMPHADHVLQHGFMIGCHPYAHSQSLHSLEAALASLSG